jgi:hypothetical protein
MTDAVATTTDEVAVATNDVAATTDDVAATTNEVAATTNEVAATTDDVATTRLIGKRVQKLFEGHGMFGGHVVAYANNVFTIKYSDGDSEEMVLAELKQVLVEGEAHVVAAKKQKRKRAPCQRSDRPEIYQQKSGKWVSRTLGSKRRFGSRAAAEAALLAMGS